jgi:S-DNA-T family DNA segregation ATPase FtsK/SpoIIIE
VPDGAEVQFAFAGTAPERWRGAVAALVRRQQPGSTRPARIRALPAVIGLGQLLTQCRTPVEGLSIIIGVGGDTADPLVLDLAAGAHTLLVIGATRSGRSVALASVGAQLKRRPRVRLVVLAPPRSPLSRVVAGFGATLTDGPHGIAAVAGHTVVLIDDCEHIADTPAERLVLDRLRARPDETSVVAAMSPDQLAAAFRGLAAQLRRVGCGLLLQPAAGDGELLGVTLPRQQRPELPGRGVLVSDPAWELPRTLAVQVAMPDLAQPICG